MMKCSKFAVFLFVALIAPNARGSEATAQPTAKAAERADQLKAAVKSFALELHFQGDQAKNYDSLVLSVPVRRYLLPRNLRVADISEEQAKKIIDYLATEGFLDQAHEGMQNLPPTPKPDSYSLVVRANGQGKFIVMEETFGWGKPMLTRLDGLRKVLDGDAAKEMDVLLGKLSEQRKAATKTDADPKAGSAGPPAARPVADERDPSGFVWANETSKTSAKAPLIRLPDDDKAVLTLELPADPKAQLWFRFGFGLSGNSPLRFITDSFSFKDGVAELAYHRISRYPGPPPTPIYFSQGFALGRPAPGQYVLRVIESGKVEMERKWAVVEKGRATSQPASRPLDHRTIASNGGTLAVVDGQPRLVKTPSAWNEWTLRETGKGWTVQGRLSGEKPEARYLSVDKDGKVTLDSELGDGAYWKLTRKGDRMTSFDATLQASGGKFDGGHLEIADKQEQIEKGKFKNEPDRVNVPEKPSPRANLHIFIDGRE